jgi:ArsR family transcriptional regulator
MAVDMSPEADTAVHVAKALSDPTRFSILRAIAERPEISCQELTALFPIAQATVSHHLRVLSEAGLVAVRTEGTFHHYRVIPGALDAYARDVRALTGGKRRPPAQAGRGEGSRGGRR